ncbi:putative GMP synthase [glutamine-hydrolyzing] [Camellia lanceoleosa]|uniref:GMP synthase [glutamine-hydrolyzing] n=1 Tax=Camellia lanceoleosa TaxID=1840588 RepID=A0ACC0F7X0_9ERIC|nr:putative GMP synthase [glutamine-hydrolyzing] [Camellia lanceoleosa]
MSNSLPPPQRPKTSASYVSNQTQKLFQENTFSRKVFQTNEAYASPNIDTRVEFELQMQIVREFGSFSSYMWAYVDYKPVINRHRYPRNVPLRSPKAEAVSRDLLKRSFWFVGPVIVYSFMQAAGMTWNNDMCYPLPALLHGFESQQSAVVDHKSNV